MEHRLVVFLVSHSSAGGAQELWTNLAEGFLARGYRVKLMALYPLRAMRELPDELSWHHVVPKRPTDPVSQLRMFLALVRFLRAEKPWRIFTAMPAANVMAAAAARIAGCGTVVISHHSPVETHNPLLNLADSVAGSLRSVSSIVSVSGTVSASLGGKPRRYRAKRRTIHNALPPRIEHQLADLAQRYAPRRARNRRVVTTGRLAAQKNYPLLIRAARHLPDVTIDIVGDGPDKAKLVGLAEELGVADRVRFLGHCPREEALRLLADGDVFTQVSLFEGHSLALVEAAKLGLPLVVSDVPVQVEGITSSAGLRCGLAVGVEDDAGLAREIRELLDNPAHYEEWVARSRRLGDDATYDRMMAAYEALAA